MRGRAGDTDTLPGMPPAFELSKATVGAETVISWGGRAVFVFDPADRGMRNLAIVALTRAGAGGVEVAALFGLRPEYVSRLRARAADGGSAALLPPMGRPRALDPAGAQRVYAMADEGRSGSEIAAAVGVSAPTISRLLARRPRLEPERLDLGSTVDGRGREQSEGDGTDEPGGGETEQADGGETGQAGGGETGDAEGGDGEVAGCGVARIGDGERPCVYAGAMLLHGFLDRAGAGAVLAGLPSGLARRYDAASLMLCACFGFALGASSAEGTKHLLGADAGALVGACRFPHLRTLRPRLGALADAVDPLRLQTALAKAMLDADERPPEVFFVDDHFVAYTGGAPVAKGWNTRRRHAEPGRDDTVIVDDAWRAICFASGPPSGLSKTMWGPLDALREICGDRPVTIGFDRGGAYPKVFAELNRRGFDWVTYRRAPLAVPTVAPRRSWVSIDGRRHYLWVADETMVLEGVGQVRQISIYQAGRVVLQILTSDRATPAAALAHRLRGRWCIENSFKYLEDHHGIHWLCDYRKNVGPDASVVANPERTAARATLKTAEATVARLERAIGATATATTNTNDIAAANVQLTRLGTDLEAARVVLETARVALEPIPAKVPATDVDPDAKQATLATNRRALQMVCRLLAYNAELDLARALDNYLADPDEYRAITRHLLHQPGTITYTPTAITVTIRRPDAPRIARALESLTDQLNATPPHLPGDRRPIGYQITPQP